MKKRRLICLVLALMMVLSMLTACGGGGNDQPGNAAPAPDSGTPSDTSAPSTPDPAEESGSIRLGIWPEDTMADEIKMHEGYVKTFNAQHPNVEVVPAYYKYAPDTFIPMATAGTVPTVFECWFTEPKKLIANEMIKDITDVLAEEGWLDLMSESSRSLLTDENGRVYGVPRDPYGLGIMLNMELFEQAGLVNADGTAQYPKTWEELAETAKTIKEKTGAAGLCLLAKDGAGGWHWSNIAWDFGATLCIDNGDGTYTSNLNTSEAIAAMQYVYDLKWKYDVLTENPLQEDWGTGFTALGTGAAAMYIAAVDAVMQPTYSNGLPVDKLSLVPMPAGPAGQYSLMGGTPYMFSAEATDDEVRWALDYIQIMGKGPFPTEDALAGIEADCQYRQENGIPVIPRFKAYTGEIVDKENEIIDQYSNVDMALYQDYYDVTAQAGNLRPEEPGETQDMYLEITAVMQKVLTDPNCDIPALMEQANSNYQAILDAKYN